MARSVHQRQEGIGVALAEDEGELTVKLKTRAELFDRLAEAVAAAHAYDVPAILALPILRANGACAAWVLAETEGA